MNMPIIRFWRKNYWPKPVIPTALKPMLWPIPPGTGISCRLSNPTSLNIRIEMEIHPMEHNAMLTYVETDCKHELVWREYGPLGHNYSPMGAESHRCIRSLAQLAGDA